jgi:hypothetical protein
MPKYIADHLARPMFSQVAMSHDENHYRNRMGMPILYRYCDMLIRDAMCLYRGIENITLDNQYAI